MLTEEEITSDTIPTHVMMLALELLGCSDVFALRMQEDLPFLAYLRRSYVNLKNKNTPYLMSHTGYTVHSLYRILFYIECISGMKMISGTGTSSFFRRTDILFSIQKIQ